MPTQLPDLTGLRATAPRAKGSVHCSTSVASLRGRLAAGAAHLAVGHEDELHDLVLVAAYAIVAVSCVKEDAYKLAFCSRSGHLLDDGRVIVSPLFSGPTRGDQPRDL